MPPSVQHLLQRDVGALQSALTLEMREARLEVQMLLQAVLGVSRAWLIGHAERLLSAEEAAQYAALLQRRLAGEPMAYILDEREFFGLNLKVTPDTLIPRPETELLVELALQYLPERGASRILDLGTGSGAIALAIAHARPEAEIVAADASAAALSVAQRNAQRLGAANVRFVQSDWFAALSDERFDLIVSNPPYIAAGDVHLRQGDVRFEPQSALVSGADGLDDIRCIIAGASKHLHGWLLLEHGYDQAPRVQDLLRQAGYKHIFSAQDLAGIARASAGYMT